MLAEPIEANREDYMTVSEARERLHLTNVVMTRWLTDGTLAWERSPYDKRVKLVKRSAIEALERQPRAKKRPRKSR